MRETLNDSEDKILAFVILSILYGIHVGLFVRVKRHHFLGSSYMYMYSLAFAHIHKKT